MMNTTADNWIAAVYSVFGKEVAIVPRKQRLVLMLALVVFLLALVDGRLASLGEALALLAALLDK
jgi:hypothetical protein